MGKAFERLMKLYKNVTRRLEENFFQSEYNKFYLNILLNYILNFNDKVYAMKLECNQY